MQFSKFDVLKNQSLILKTVIKTKRQQTQKKVKAYTALSFNTDLGRFSMQKSYPSCLLPVSVHKFEISTK